MYRILVSGASGFIGSHLVKAFIKIGHDVVALVQPNSNLWRLEECFDRISILKNRLEDLDIGTVKEPLKGVKIIYHLAAAGVNRLSQNEDIILQSNILGTLHILKLARALEVERFIYCGSCFECSPGFQISEDQIPMPVSEYGVSKSAAWMLVNMFYYRYGLPVVTFRPFTVYGPFEAGYRLIPSTIIKAINKLDIELTTGEQMRDFVFIKDAIDILIKSINFSSCIGETFNICTGVATSVKDTVHLILELCGSSVKPIFGARACQDTEGMSWSGNPQKTAQRLGWQAKTDLRQGLQETIEWFKREHVKYKEYSVKL